MNIRKNTPQPQPSATERPVTGKVHGKALDTTATPSPRVGISAAARRQLKKLAPWNTWLTPVRPAPEYYPNAVKTTNCPFCGGVHVYDGPTGPDDPGIQPLLCAPGSLLLKWQVPPSPQTTVLAWEAHDDGR